MTAAYPENVGLQPQRKRAKSSLDIPRIELFSWIGLESLAWGVVLGHLVKWVGNALYFLGIQVKYLAGYGTSWHIDWYPKSLWDYAPVHLSNWLHLDWYAPALVTQHGWAPAFWVVDRHSIRDTLIALGAGFVLTLIFSKPKHAVDDNVSLGCYVRAASMMLIASVLACALVMVLNWKLPWVVNHGFQVPAHYGVLASEVNTWIAAGTWVAGIVGFAIGIALKKSPPVQRVADDIQWFVAERSAAAIRSDRGLSKLRSNRVYGTPSHRMRVHWLLDHPGVELPERNPWIVRGLVAVGFGALLFSAFGAWLTLAGPAAVH